MNVERDSDRQLRAWASEGVDTAPERIVWAALDEIERIPQRAPWRDTARRPGHRLRPAAGLVGAGAAAVVAVAVLSRVVAPNPGVGDPRDFVMADLPGIVLWEDTKPAAWTLDNLVSNPREVLEIPIRSMTVTEIGNLPEPDGFIGGRYTNFGGPGAPAFMSWGALFESDAAGGRCAPVLPARAGSDRRVGPWCRRADGPRRRRMEVCGRDDGLHPAAGGRSDPRRRLPVARRQPAARRRRLVHVRSRRRCSPPPMAWTARADALARADP